MISGASEQTAKPDTLGTIGVVFPPGSKRVLFPLYSVQMEEAGSYAGAALAGELYGVHWAPDSLASTESTVGGYTLFPDINRVEWHSFMALGDE